jgi:hypothetical protein
MAIDFTKSNIPTIPEPFNSKDLIDGDASGTNVGTDVFANVGAAPDVDFGMGPEGNMFGVQSPQTANAIESAMNFAGAPVDERNDFQPIEAVEGFGEPEKGSMATPFVTRIGS